MKVLIWFLRLIVFIALFGLAVKNSASVDLCFYFNQHLNAPLSLVVLVAFAMGLGIGVSVAAMTLLQQRREIRRMRRRATDVGVEG